MGNCTSGPGVVDDEIFADDNAAAPNASASSCLAPGSEHVITRFKNQDVSALATKYMPKDAVTALAAPSAPAATLVSPCSSSSSSSHAHSAAAARNLISTTPAAMPPHPTSLASAAADGFAAVASARPPLALGALGDNSLDDEPGARTVR